MSETKEKAEQRQINVQINEADVNTNYANAFRTNGTAEEVILDFGLNVVNPTDSKESTTAMMLKINQRVIMNYYSAKRLALALGQVLHRHEEQFGPIELDAAKRQKK